MEKATTAEITISQFSDFFVRFNQLKQAEARQFILHFDTFKPRYEIAREEAEIATRQFAPGFNIFIFLEVSRQEKFHSGFIAYLLNPQKNHGQGHLFLQTFFQTIQHKHPSLPLPDIPLNHGSWQVRREVVTRDGNLDIVLSNPSLKVLYVIENKVDAGEQRDQLSRYANYLERQKKDYPYQGLLFLTPDGRSSLTARDKHHHPISYHSDIRAWLELAMPEVQAATVHETIQQYSTSSKIYKAG